MKEYHVMDYGVSTYSAEVTHEILHTDTVCDYLSDVSQTVPQTVLVGASSIYYSVHQVQDVPYC